MTGVGIELSQTLVWTAKKIDDVKENFENLMEDVRDIKKTIKIYHGSQDPKGNSPTGQNPGN